MMKKKLTGRFNFVFQHQRPSMKLLHAYTYNGVVLKSYPLQFPRLQVVSYLLLFFFSKLLHVLPMRKSHH